MRDFFCVHPETGADPEVLVRMNKACFVAFLCCAALSPAACSKPSAEKGSEKNEAAPSAEALVIRPGFKSGKIHFSGTVSAPVDLPAGAVVQLSVQEVRENFDARFGFGDKASLTLKAAAKTIPFEIKGIEPGKYHLAMVVRKEQRESIADGDWLGFHGGTLGAHIQDPSKSVVIEVKEGAPLKADFAIGQVKCRAKFSEACSEDDDCRGTKCVDKKGGWITTFPNSCDSATKKCKPLSCNADDKLEEGDCI